jgi:hypothetical protein
MIIASTSILSNKMDFIKQILGSSLFVAREREGGSRATLLGGAFREAKYEKLRRRKSEGGAGIHFPYTPFSSRPARAEKFSALPREAR